MSLVSGIFKPAEASAPSSQGITSQTMPLLEAPKQLAAGSEQKEVVIVDEALVANTTRIGDSAVVIQPASTQITTYVVKDGDTLAGIAKMFGVSAATISGFNTIKAGTPLKAGQVIRILPFSTVSLTVAKGETVQGIAKRLGADADEIIQYNDLEGPLKAGQVILIPDAEGEVAETLAKANSKTTTVKTAVSKAVGSAVAAVSGKFARPAAGVCTQGPHGPHRGVDIGGGYGSSIRAAAAGKVVIAKSGYNGGYGNMVAISHAGGVETLYGHLSSISVSEGETVSAGQVIGGMGNSGLVRPSAGGTGTHLHFETRGASNSFCR